MNYTKKQFNNDQPLIFHIDVNSAFLSWTAVKRLQDDPNSIDLRTIPSAIGGDITTRHGIITAKSIPAKKYNIITGESVVSALQKCPNLVLTRSDFSLYKHFSKLFIETLHKYTDNIQQVSIDEAYCNMTGLYEYYRHLETKETPYPMCLAYAIKDDIRINLGFTVNVGISSNKLLAKMASDFQKPDKVHTLFPEEIQEKMWPLPINELHGCGKATAQRLNSIGIHTIKDAALTDQAILRSQLGEKAGDYIYYSANGINNSKVNPQKREAKSYSNELTTSSNITVDTYDTDMPPLLDSLAKSVSNRLKKDEQFASTIGAYVKTNTFKTHSAQTTLSASTNDYKIILDTANALLNKLLLGENGLFIMGEQIRLVGISASNLDDGSFRQMSLFDLI